MSTPRPSYVRPSASSVQHTGGFYPGCEGCQPEEYSNYVGEYCRCYDLSDAEIDPQSIDVRRVLSDSTGLELADIPDELIARAIDELVLDKPEGYVLQVEGDYYGDIATVYFAVGPGAVTRCIKEFYGI